jgi:hypothetical protein
VLTVGTLTFNAVELEEKINLCHFTILLLVQINMSGFLSELPEDDAYPHITATRNIRHTQAFRFSA